MNRQQWMRIVTVSCILTTVNACGAEEPLHYPTTRRIEHSDDYHGVKVADPYRWLENDVRTDAEVKSWVNAQNKVTADYFRDIPERNAIENRLKELWNYERMTAPRKMGGYYFFSKNDGLQNQAVTFIQESLKVAPRVLLDPNSWSKDGTVALSGFAVADDGQHAAYGVAEAGSDWVTWRVLVLPSGKVLDDEVKWVKYSTASWSHDGSGFFYGRFAEPKAGEKFQALNKNQKIYFHKIGTRQSDDVLVYQRPDQPDWGFGVTPTEDGRYLVLTTHVGTAHKHRIAYRDLAEPFAAFSDIVDHFDNEFTFIGNDGPLFYFKTDADAPRGRVVGIDIRKSEKANWQEIIPQAKNALQSVGLVGNMFVAHYLDDAKTQVKMFSPAGEFVRAIPFPGIGSADGFAGRRKDTETFYTFSSFATPATIYRYDMLTGRSDEYWKAKVKFNPSDYEVKQAFVSSKDGTKVPLFIAYKKGLKLDGSNAALLYGYGGFNISLTPSFDVRRLAWMELGGVMAVACLRGGNEYGEDWHQAGTKLNKQNVFDDFIACAEWLIKNGYSEPKKLAIQGGSNGGLLVGAAMTQRPELFGAALPAVGVMDMLRFQKFTAGRFWTDDYGSSDKPDEFKALIKYSPYHNLKPGVTYPATLVTTADTDDRVVPGHSFKFTAMLQHCHAGSPPVLARIETRAGHGAGKPTAKLIEEVADQWTFLVKNLNMHVAAPKVK